MTSNLTPSDLTPSERMGQLIKEMEKDGVDISALCLAELFTRRTNLLRIKQQAECRERREQS
jgi:hypothetical protein